MVGYAEVGNIACKHKLECIVQGDAEKTASARKPLQATGPMNGIGADGVLMAPAILTNVDTNPTFAMFSAIFRPTSSRGRRLHGRNYAIGQLPPSRDGVELIVGNLHVFLSGELVELFGGAARAHLLLQFG